MKKKKFYLWILGLFILFGSGFAQEQTFRFKLYMESANGKKDTLELGVGPNGYVGCDYDSIFSQPVFEPFSDTVEHIGAFVVPELEMVGELPPSRNRIVCPVYLKKHIGQFSEDITVIVPIEAQPVKLSWDRSLLQDPVVSVPYLTTWLPRYRFDVRFWGYWFPILVRLSKDSTCTIHYEEPGSQLDSLVYFTYIPDSSGKEHAYLLFYVRLGDIFVANEDNPIVMTSVRIVPNPVRDRFVWESSLPLRKWEIYSLTGQLLQAGNDAQKEIECKNWPTGMYVFRWENNRGESGYTKLIKN